MTIEELRTQIDAADEQLLEAFAKRMNVSDQIADYKREHGLPVLDSARERQKLADVVSRAEAPVKPYVGALYHLLFELSRLYQGEKMRQHSALVQKVQNAIEQSESLFPQEALVACQGVEGAYSQIACEKLFKVPNIMCFKSFDAVFAAIDKGLCRYGVLPVENSTAGSVNRIYDLMMQYDFSIVRSVRMKINHNLLAKPGTALNDVREVYSHPQALAQCAEYLERHPKWRQIPYDNTALAVKKVAEDGDCTQAAVGSKFAAELFGLEVLAENIYFNKKNSTRFIIVTNQRIFRKGANKISICFETPHSSGSLYDMLSHIIYNNLNMNNIESRPIPGKNWEYRFFVDFEGNLNDGAVKNALRGIREEAINMKILGNY